MGPVLGEGSGLAGSAGATWIAPVGQALAQAPHAVHRGKSMTGKPRWGRGASGFGSVTIPVRTLRARILNIAPPLAYRSFPEYERLKLLLITGKSGMMLPGTASASPGQFLKLGSVTFTRVRTP